MLLDNKKNLIYTRRNEVDKIEELSNYEKPNSNLSTNQSEIRVWRLRPNNVVSSLFFQTFLSFFVDCELPSGSRSLVTPYSRSAMWKTLSRRSRG